MTPQRIGFIGLGRMGTAMALNLVRAGFPMTVFNRTHERTRPLAAAGASVAASAADVAQASDVVITSLADDAAVERVMLGRRGVVQGAHEGLIVLDTSTISPLTSRRIAATVRAGGAQMLDAPVSGTVKPAEEGTLTFLVGGEKAVLEECRLILETLGQKIFHMGANGMGLYMKLATNLVLGMTLEMLAEALSLGEKAGLDRASMLDALASTGLYSPLMAGKRQAFLEERFPPSFPLRLMYKDYGLILAAAQALRVPLPTAAVAAQLYGAAANDRPDEDFAAIFKTVREMA